jgi:phage/plasmid-associated DNA primase
MNFDIKSIIPSGNFQIDKPITLVEEQVKEQNKDKILLFLEDITKQFFNDIGDFEIIKYSNQELFEMWIEWLKESHIDIKMDKHKFGIKISQLIKSKLKNDEIIKNLKHSTTKINYKKLAEYFKII